MYKRTQGRAILKTSSRRVKKRRKGEDGGEEGKEREVGTRLNTK